jgi:hypothetical protein
MSSTEPPLLLLPGIWPRFTHSMPCCAAKVTNCISVFCLSPFWEPEFVKPAASLSAQRCSIQRCEEASMNCLEGRRGTAHVGRAAEDHRVAGVERRPRPVPPRFSSSATGKQPALTPLSEAMPSATASACFCVWP